MSLYLDANIIVPLAVREAKSLVIRDWLDRQGDDFVVGRLAVAEMGSAVSRRRRMKTLDERQGDLAMATLDAWIEATATVVDHEPRDVIEAARLVRRPFPKLLTADAVHLATCRRLGHCLITDDRDLTEAAKLYGITPLSPN